MRFGRVDANKVARAVGRVGRAFFFPIRVCRVFDILFRTDAVPYTRSLRVPTEVSLMTYTLLGLTPPCDTERSELMRLQAALEANTVLRP